jgi:hypothetical protein
MMRRAADWNKKHGVVAPGEFIYDSTKDPMRPLKVALHTNDIEDAATQIRKLISSGAKTSEQLIAYFRHYGDRGFAGPEYRETLFRASLSASQLDMYWKAKQGKLAVNTRFLEALGKANEIGISTGPSAQPGAEKSIGRGGSRSGQRPGRRSRQR